MAFVNSSAWLVFIALTGLALLLILILRFKLNAAISLLVTTLFIGVGSGMPPPALTSAIVEGVSSILGNLTLLIGLGCMISALLEASGGIHSLTGLLNKKLGENKAPWILGLASMLVAIPVYFDAALILLMPIALGMAREKKRSTAYYTMPLAAGLVAGSGYIPPAPHPLLVATVLGANISYVIGAGVLTSLVSVAWGVLFSGWIGKKINALPPPTQNTRETAPETAPGFGAVMSIILTPLVLIMLGTLAQNWTPSLVRDILVFVGTPFVALLLTVLLSMAIVFRCCRFDRSRMGKIMSEGLHPAGMILLVIGVGGALRFVLQDSGIGDLIGKGIVALGLPLPVMGFLLAAILRGAIGSTPVVVTMTSGIMAVIPGVALLGPVQLAGLTIAICGGASTLCHVTSAGFWLAHALMGTDTKTSLKTWGVNESIVGLIGGIMGSAIFMLA